MELNVFTQQLEQCYNILSQQFIIIKQLKDLTLGSTNQGSVINELNQKLSALDETITHIYKHSLICNGELELTIYSFGSETKHSITLDTLKDITQSIGSNYIISNCGTFINNNERYGILCLTYDKNYDNVISLKTISANYYNEVGHYTITYINSDTVTQIR